MKGLFDKLKSSIGLKRNSNINLPEIIKTRNELKVRESDIIDPIDKILKKEDPLKLRISIEKYDYLNEYYNNLTIKDKTINSFNRFLLFIGFKSQKYHNMNLERIKDPYFMTPAYGQTADPSNSYLLNNYFYMITIGICSILGYCWARLRYDIYFRRMAYSHFPLLMIYFEKFDSYFKKADETLDYYFPKDMNENEFQYLLYKYIVDYKEKRKVLKRISKYDYINKDIIELDKLLNQIKS